eukprot:1160914-Pelagomonas_calceolata.AAC.7
MGLAHPCLDIKHRRKDFNSAFKRVYQVPASFFGGLLKRRQQVSISNVGTPAVGANKTRAGPNKSTKATLFPNGGKSGLYCLMEGNEPLFDFHEASLDTPTAASLCSAGALKLWEHMMMKARSIS